MDTNRRPAVSGAGTHPHRDAHRAPRRRWTPPLLGLGALLCCLSATPANHTAGRFVSPRVLIVGGGPDLRNNQVAIESNVRYVGTLLPQDAPRITLFADGNVNNATVLYDEGPQARPAGERVFNLLFRINDSGAEGRYRKPKLGAKLDGASKKPEIDRAFAQLASDTDDPKRPVLLYFTGHGSRNQNDLENNLYDLWGSREGLTVRDLSKQIARLPAETPVAIVMVQCFSGAFGNLVFENGDPQGQPISRDFAGFYATVKERVAAGCTSAVNEEDYHDFTSYFFAALTGRDRVGRRVTGADYNGDGRVGMDEAYCYTLIHDNSIDVPICTSDVFLRRYVPLKENELFQAPYSAVLTWATPAQRAALEQLSTTLNKHGDDRLATSYVQMTREIGAPNWRSPYRDATQRFSALRREGRTATIARWPDLQRQGTDAYRQARLDAIAQLDREAAAGKWKALLDANEAVDRSDQDGEAQEIAASRNLRYVRLGKTVIIAHWLKEHGAPEIKARYARLVAAEGRSPIPPYGDNDRRGVSPDPLDSSAAMRAPASPHSAGSCCTWDQMPIPSLPCKD